MADMQLLKQLGFSGYGSPRACVRRVISRSNMSTLISRSSLSLELWEDRMLLSETQVLSLFQSPDHICLLSDTWTMKWPTHNKDRVTQEVPDNVHYGGINWWLVKDKYKNREEESGNKKWGCRDSTEEEETERCSSSWNRASFKNSTK